VTRENIVAIDDSNVITKVILKHFDFGNCYFF